MKHNAPVTLTVFLVGSETFSFGGTALSATRNISKIFSKGQFLNLILGQVSFDAGPSDLLWRSELVIC